MNKKLFLRLIYLLFLLPQIGYGSSKDVLQSEKALITLRKIGDNILKDAADSTSLIFPIERIDSHSFLIKFENPFAFKPQTLVETIHSHLEKDGLPLNYMVEVTRPENQVVYSYEIKSTIEGSAIPCLEREPDEGNYTIKIIFVQPSVHTSTINWSNLFYFPLSALILLIGWIFRNQSRTSKKSTAPQPEEVNPNIIQLGRFSFSLDTLILRHQNERVELSSKEAKLLKVFALAPNQILERDKLLKEVWEDEGVFVGRSLDVFISKLRKKLQSDASIRLINIHGRGYKLEVNA